MLLSLYAAIDAIHTSILAGILVVQGGQACKKDNRLLEHASFHDDPLPDTGGAYGVFFFVVVCFFCLVCS